MHIRTIAIPARLRRVETRPAVLQVEESFHGMVGLSPQMRSIYSKLEKIAPHFRSVLLTGETGTGKELAARALHEISPAAGNQFVTLNCSAVVETLFESELFGYVRGAFTGASHDKMGLFEFAHGGTLFLDEIGDMPLSTQAKLLRAVQNQEIVRVGSVMPRKVNVRVIAATNKDLRAAVAAKEFREDLYYRLSMVEIALPPLRARSGDLQRLIQGLLQQWSERMGLFATLSEEAMAALTAHHWPGNVRELENALGHALMMASGPVIDADDLPASLTRRPVAPIHEVHALVQGTLGSCLSDALEESEVRLIQQALDQSERNQSRAARLLGTGRDRLRYKMKKYGLVNESRRRMMAGRESPAVA